MFDKRVAPKNVIELVHMIECSFAAGLLWSLQPECARALLLSSVNTRSSCSFWCALSRARCDHVIWLHGVQQCSAVQASE